MRRGKLEYRWKHFFAQILFKKVKISRSAVIHMQNIKFEAFWCEHIYVYYNRHN